MSCAIQTTSHNRTQKDYPLLVKANADDAASGGRWGPTSDDVPLALWGQSDHGSLRSPSLLPYIGELGTYWLGGNGFGRESDRHQVSRPRLRGVVVFLRVSRAVYVVVFASVVVTLCVSRAPHVTVRKCG